MTASTSRRGPRAASIAGLILALASPLLIPLLPGQAHQNIADVGQDVVVVVFEWVVVGVLLGLIVPWERLPLRTLGFRAPTWRDMGAMALALVAMVATLAAFTAATHARAGDGATPAQIAAIPLVLRIVIFLTAGFCEELMFRAYAVERLTLLTGNIWIAGIASVVFFTLGHVPRYGFTPSLAAVAIIAAFLTGLYLWRRNFWACATMHAIIDCVGLVVVPALAAHAR